MTATRAPEHGTPPPRPKPELVVKDPALLWGWMKAYSEHCFLEALEEVLEEKRERALVALAIELAEPERQMNVDLRRCAWTRKTSKM